MTAFRPGSLGLVGAVVVGAGVSLLAGGLLATASPPPFTALVLLAAALGVPVMVSAVASVAQTTKTDAAVLVCLGSLYAVTVHRSPDISLLELALLVPSLVLVAAELPKLRLVGAGAGAVKVAILSATLILALGAVYAVHSPVGRLDPSAPTKEFLKNVEIFLLAAGAFCYTRSLERLTRVYALLIVVATASTVQTVAATHGHVLSGQSLQTSAPLFAFALAVPFLHSRPVAILAAASFALIVVSRTRGAWLGLLLVAVVAIVSRRSRRGLGKRGRAAALLAAVGMVALVASSPALLSRAASFTSGHDQSVHDRTAMLRAAAYEMTHHPLTGVGPGNFKPWLLDSPPVVTFQIGVALIPRDPHDAFAKFGAEMGIPGLLLFSGWALGVIGVAWRFRSTGTATASFRRYSTGLGFYALLLGLDLLTAEWASLSRLEIALGSGALLALARVTPSAASARSEGLA